MARIPGIPYGPAPRTAGYASSLAQPPKLVVVHCTSNTASAAAEANYAATRTDDRSHWTSCHVYVDTTGPLGSLDLSLQAWAAYGWANARGWHVELCGKENAVPEATQRAGAAIVRQLCLMGGISMEHLDGAAVRALHDGTRTRGGVTGHIDITTAGFDGNDHTDPGDRFDWTRFMGWVTAGSTTGGDVDAEQDRMLRNVDAIGYFGLLLGQETVPGIRLAAGTADRPFELMRVLHRLEAAAAADATRDIATRAAVDALAQAIAAGGGSVDSAAVIARINEVAEQESAAVAALHEQIADLTTRLAAAERAKGEAAAAALDA